MNAYRVELRRHPLRWWIPVLAGAAAFMMFGRSRDWIGVWPQASAAVQLSAPAMAPLLAGCVAWGMARLRGENGPYAAARPTWQARAAQAAAALTYAVGVYLAAAVAAVTVSGRLAGPGLLWPSYLALGCSLLLLATAVGMAT
ncbi:MAG TPA: hypothetical protein VFY17_05845, partial [Pilimelia sp.]|nr:hypothetical protein [Pilimelia sp.]